MNKKETFSKVVTAHKLRMDSKFKKSMDLFNRIIDRDKLYNHISHHVIFEKLLIDCASKKPTVDGEYIYQGCIPLRNSVLSQVQWYLERSNKARKTFDNILVMNPDIINIVTDEIINRYIEDNKDWEGAEFTLVVKGYLSAKIIIE